MIVAGVPPVMRLVFRLNGELEPKETFDPPVLMARLCDPERTCLAYAEGSERGFSSSPDPPTRATELPPPVLAPLNALPLFLNGVMVVGLAEIMPDIRGRSRHRGLWSRFPGTGMDKPTCPIVGASS